MAPAEFAQWELQQICYMHSGVSWRCSPGDYKATSGVVTMKALSLRQAIKKFLRPGHMLLDMDDCVHSFALSFPMALT